MKLDDIKHVAVIGAGDMGHGIAEVALMTGYSVSLYDIADEFVEKGKNRIDWSLKKFVEKARITEKDYEKFMKNLTTTISIEEAAKNADLCIEAAPENLELKKKIFGDLDKFAPKHAILASNTSNMSITEIGDVTSRPEKVAGLHYFNPPVMMQLIEITRGDKSSDETIDILVGFTKKSLKDPVVCQKDSAGFIANRLNAPNSLLLQLMLDRKEHEPARFDAACMQMGMRMGFYELGDFAGLDILYHSLKYFEKRLSPDYAPPPLMEKMIKDNHLGKKTGQGIYKWPEVGRPEIDMSDPADFDIMNLSRIQINEAAKVLEEGLASAKDIDIAMKKGYNLPWGPFELAENTDLNELAEYMNGLADKYGKEVFRAHKWIQDGTLLEHTKGEVEAKKAEKSQYEFETVEIIKDTENFVTTLLMNRPPLNLMDNQLLSDLRSALELLVEDNETRVIVLRGAANCFSGGFDMASGLYDSAWDVKKGVVKGQRTFKRFRDIPKPVIAAIERYAFGGGLELAMSCDLRYAKKSAKMGLTEVTLGLIPGWGGTQLMVRHLGIGKTMELILTGERIKAKRAFKMGLINRAFDDEDFEEEVYKIAKKIATESSPISVGIVKQLVNFGGQIPLDVGLEWESYGSALNFTTEDLQEGVMSFMQKKKPEFKNK
ncbi:MAG: 3-hydroxyacyl-CoA dehydrogenase NAD-binding domain-containing protein [Candidatus Hodarchaeales archaeon]|jgi:enoyl-CoA hydratase/3-hydroxyacyl-CoA dehydrogenase